MAKRTRLRSTDALLIQTVEDNLRANCLNHHFIACLKAESGRHRLRECDDPFVADLDGVDFLHSCRLYTQA